MTERHLRQGGSSWTTAPAAAVHAQRTGTQPGTPQPRSPWSTPSPAAHPIVFWKVGKERRQPHQPQLQDKSSSSPVQWRIAKQQFTGHNWQNLLETDGYHDEILSADNGYQLCPMQPSHWYWRESPFHQLLGTANYLGQRTLPIALREAMMTLSLISATGSIQIEPTLRKRGNPDLLQWRSERNCRQLKQKHVS